MYKFAAKMHDVLLSSETACICYFVLEWNFKPEESFFLEKY